MGAVALVSTLTISGSYTKALDLTTPKESVSLQFPSGGQSYLNGPGSEQGNLFFADRRSLVATLETIDLTSTLKDAFGDTMALAKIKEIIIINNETGTGKNLTLSGNALVAFGAGGNETVGPKGVFHRSSPIDGFTITNTTQDQLTIDAGANTISYDLIIIGNT